MRINSLEETIEGYVSKFDMSSFLNEHLIANLELFHFPIYSHIYIEQDEQHYLYFLLKGQVQCNHYHLNGKLAVFALANPFAAIGDIEILNDEKVQSNVIATQDTIMLGIASDIVRRYGAHDPTFLRFLIDELRRKLYETNSLQMNQILPVINRLALYMLAQAQKHEKDELVLPDKEDLASLLGATPRHLNRVIKELVESEIISSGYPLVHIYNREALEELTL